jgi:Fur family ferric uptake transcriptional regulator
MKRATQQRTAIRNAITSAGRPLSVNEILEIARQEVARLGIATVYRNLKVLQEESQVVPVDLPGQAPRWEAYPGGHHHHFLCRTCDKLYEIHDCPKDLLRMLPEGYTLEEHTILLCGQCETCIKNARTQNRQQGAQAHLTQE